MTGIGTRPKTAAPQQFRQLSGTPDERAGSCGAADAFALTGLILSRRQSEVRTDFGRILPKASHKVAGKRGSGARPRFGRAASPAAAPSGHDYEFPDVAAPREGRELSCWARCQTGIGSGPDPMIDGESDGDSPLFSPSRASDGDPVGESPTEHHQTLPTIRQRVAPPRPPPCGPFSILRLTLLHLLRVQAGELADIALLKQTG